MNSTGGTGARRSSQRVAQKRAAPHMEDTSPVKTKERPTKRAREHEAFHQDWDTTLEYGTPGGIIEDADHFMTYVVFQVRYHCFPGNRVLMTD